MPNIHNVQQGTPEWMALRAGIPTASMFDKIVTATGKLSKQSRDYKVWLLAERVMGRPIETKKTAAMIRGTEFEQEAVDFYQAVKEVKTEVIGFVTTDDNRIGASPDRWAGSDGELEIKVPEPQTHMAYFLAQAGIDRYGAELEEMLAKMESANRERKGDDLKKIFLVDADLQQKYDEAVSNCIEREYRVQYTGQLVVTGKAWNDILSYSPEGLPPVFVHIEANKVKPFMDILEKSVREFSDALEADAADYVKRGIIQQ